MPSLRELWTLPLEEQQKLRTYKRWDEGREEQLKRENAAPDFPKHGGFYLLKEQRSGRTIVIDPARPWIDARVFVHEELEVAKGWIDAMNEAEQRPVKKYAVPPAAPRVKCRGITCGAPIVWINTESGRKMPVDPDGTPHWATCPNARSFKR